MRRGGKVRGRGEGGDGLRGEGAGLTMMSKQSL